MYLALKQTFDLMQANPNVWWGWTEYQAGRANNEDYPGLTQPRAFDPSLSFDRPQMDILNTYATGGSWPCTTYASGTSGACLLSQYNFNVKFP
jgi:hypothetical protein